MQPAATRPDTEEEKRLSLAVVRTRETLGMFWIRTAACPVGDHSSSSKLQISPAEQSATLRYPALLLVFMVPHGPHRTLQEALDNIFAVGSSVDYSYYPGAGICHRSLRDYPDPVRFLFFKLSTLDGPQRPRPHVSFVECIV